MMTTYNYPTTLLEQQTQHVDIQHTAPYAARYWGRIRTSKKAARKLARDVKQTMRRMRRQEANNS